MNTYTLESEITSYLKNHREFSTSELVQIFTLKGFTKQGVYRVLRKLADSGMILWKHGHVTINYLWLVEEIKQLSNLLPERSLIYETYERKQTHIAKTLNELDAIFGQVFISILSTLPKKLPFALFYDLHNYTYIHKIPLVDWYIDFLNQKVEKSCLLVGSESKLDRELQKKMLIPTHCIPKKWNTFLTVIDDFIIYNHVDQKIWKEADTIFKTKSVKEAQEEIVFLAQKKGKYKIVVERDKKKAFEIEKVFRKYFVLPKI